MDCFSRAVANALATLDTICGCSNILQFIKVDRTIIQTLLAFGAFSLIKLDLEEADPVKQSENSSKWAKVSAPESACHHKKNQCHCQSYQMNVEKCSETEFRIDETMRY